MRTNETKASIKLKFATPKEKDVLIVRNFQLSCKNKKYEFKRLEQLLKSHNSSGEIVTINANCADIDKQVPILMHSSKAILENVIFCHQEDTNWPFSEPANLKKVFDEIFDTAKYSKSIDYLKELNKDYHSKAKEAKNKLELFQKDHDHYKKILESYKLNCNSISELTLEINKIQEKILEEEKNLKGISQIEENKRIKENDIYLLQLKIEEKKRNIQNIYKDPFFEDYTQNEENYRNLINNYENNYNDFLLKIEETKSKLNFFHEENKNLSNEKYALDLNLFSTRDTLKKQISICIDYVKELRRIEPELRICVNKLFTNEKNMEKMQIDEEGNLTEKNLLKKEFENFEFIPIGFFSDLFVNENNIPINKRIFEDVEILFKSFNFEYLRIVIEEKVKEYKEKISSIEEKKKVFNTKIIEKTNEYELKNMLLENKNKEINILQVKINQCRENISNKEKLKNDLENFSEQKSKANEMKNKLNFEILEVENLIDGKNLEKIEISDQLNSLNIPNSFLVNFEISIYNLKNLEKYLNELFNKNKQIEDILKDANNRYSVNLCTLIELMDFANHKKNEFIEERTKMRELNFSLSRELEVIDKKIADLANKIISENSKKNCLMNDQEFKKGLRSLNFDEGILNDAKIDFIANYLEENELSLKKLEEEIHLKKIEIKFNEKNNDHLCNEKKCAICKSEFSKENINKISEDLSKINNHLYENIKENEKKVSEKIEILQKVKNINETITELKKINEIINKNNSEKESFIREKIKISEQLKFNSNISKEKNNDLFYIEKYLNEEIFKIKNQQEDLIKLIYENLKNIEFNFDPFINELQKEKSSSTKNYENVSVKISEFNLNNDDVKMLNNDFNETFNESETISEIEKFKIKLKKGNFSELGKFIEEKKEISGRYKSIKECLKSIEKEGKELHNKKSEKLKKLNSLNEEIRQLEINLNTIKRESNADISNKIEDFENELQIKINEKTQILIDISKTEDVKAHLNTKKDEFDRIISEKLFKYEKLIEKLSNTKIRIEMFLLNNPEENFIKFYQKQIINLIEKSGKIENLKKSKEILINEKTGILKKMERDYENVSVRESMIKNNKLLYEFKSELNLLNEEYSKIKIENNEDENFAENKKELFDRLSELNRNYNLNLGKLSELNNNKYKSEAEMRNDSYYEIESRYNKCKMEYIASVETSKYIDM